MAMKPDLAAYLKTLDFTGPVIDLIDALTDWLMDNRAMGYEKAADLADRMVLPRLK